MASSPVGITQRTFAGNVLQLKVTHFSLNPAFMRLLHAMKCNAQMWKTAYLSGDPGGRLLDVIICRVFSGYFIDFAQIN
jgi:hypothetical protein